MDVARGRDARRALRSYEVSAIDAEASDGLMPDLFLGGSS
jgi:hypothetical protein